MNKTTSCPLIYANIVFRPADSEIIDRDRQDLVRYQTLLQNKVVYFGAAANPRTANTSNPWHCQVPADYELPKQVDRFDLDFESVTDLRAQQIAKQCETHDLDLVVHWSGGIDSTTILAAMIRNFDRRLLSRIYVWMNNASYLENPHFYQTVIVKHNLRHGQCAPVWTDCKILNGHPADALWAQADILEINRYHKNCWQNHPVQNPDCLLSWFEKKTGQELATWFYELVIQSSESAGIELLTYEDFYWWSNFNLWYVPQALCGFRDIPGKLKSDDYITHASNLIPWFHSPEYQSWSMANRSSGQKFDGTVRGYKRAAKDYIFSVDHNAYYRDYKTKTGSNLKPYKSAGLLALYADGTTVYNDRAVDDYPVPTN